MSEDSRQSPNSFTPSWSEYLPIRGVRYHVRHWGTVGAPKIFLFHGWMDVSATWQFLVDELIAQTEWGDWHFIAPDWSGYGLSESRPGGSLLLGFVGDMEQLVQHYAGDEMIKIVGHSMGANLSCIYAGARRERVSHLVNLEGLSPMPGPLFHQPLPAQVARWLSGSKGNTRDYSSREEFAQRLVKKNSLLTESRAAFLATHFLTLADNGRYVPRATAEARQMAPIYPHVDQIMELLRNISAQVLLVQGTESFVHKAYADHKSVLAERLACFKKRSDLILQGASHNVHHEFPTKIATETLALFTR